MKLNRMKSISIIACLCFLLYQPCRAQQHPSEAEHDWVHEHFFNVLRESLPIEDGLESAIGYRSYRDLYTDELEYSFVFNLRHQQGQQGYALNVVVRMADSVSLYDQIMALHRRNSNESIESIKQQLRIMEVRLSEAGCPAVRRQYDEFYRLCLVMRSARDRADEARGEATIILHPRVHTIKADISDGNMELVVVGGHPFARWAERTRRAFEACAVSNTSQTIR